MSEKREIGQSPPAVKGCAGFLIVTIVSPARAAAFRRSRARSPAMSETRLRLSHRFCRTPARSATAAFRRDRQSEIASIWLSVMVAFWKLEAVKG